MHSFPVLTYRCFLFRRPRDHGDLHVQTHSCPTRRSSYLLADLEDAAAAVSSLRGVDRGRLRVTMPTAYGVIHLLPKLPEFLARHPEVTQETELNDRIVNMVVQGFEVAVRVGELQDRKRVLAGQSFAFSAALG